MVAPLIIPFNTLASPLQTFNTLPIFIPPGRFLIAWEAERRFRRRRGDAAAPSCYQRRLLPPNNSPFSSFWLLSSFSLTF